LFSDRTAVFGGISQSTENGVHPGLSKLSVGSHVTGQVVRNKKSFSTLRATARIFVSMCSHVHGLADGIGKCFPHSWQQ